jgi:predicted AlkP superfamily pyrophosphatase or phosphodiesterase
VPAAPPSAAATAASPRPPTLILLSFDGWRWDYDRKAPTPHLHRLMARGVRAERLIPSFPSKTFPNHYTIVTGLYPGHHGIVANNMYDPDSGLWFSLANREAVGDTRWWGGEPIWVTAQRQGLRTATLFWPGSEAPIGNLRPDDWSPYDGTLTNAERVDRILAWLDRPDAERPRFITGYFEDTDDAGHQYGPESPELRDAVTKLDVALGRLIDGIDARGLTDRVNLVVTSDHGMSETSVDRVIVIDDYLDDYLRAGSVEIIDLDPTIGLAPRGVGVDEVYRRLAGAHPHLRVYRKEDSPTRWRYRDHPRIPAIVGVADDGWRIRRRPAIASASADAAPARTVGGAHGYDPEVRNMHGLFVAAGPSFRRDVVVPPFENVHIYHALAAALNLRPAQNDGDPAIARRLLGKNTNTKDTKVTKKISSSRVQEENPSYSSYSSCPSCPSCSCFYVPVRGRTNFPGACPVIFPSLSTHTPFTRTCGTPSA